MMNDKPHDFAEHQEAVNNARPASIRHIRAIQLTLDQLANTAEQGDKILADGLDSEARRIAQLEARVDALDEAIGAITETPAPEARTRPQTARLIMAIMAKPDSVRSQLGKAVDIMALLGK